MDAGRSPWTAHATMGIPNLAAFAATTTIFDRLTDCSPRFTDSSLHSGKLSTGHVELSTLTLLRSRPTTFVGSGLTTCWRVLMLYLASTVIDMSIATTHPPLHQR